MPIAKNHSELKIAKSKIPHGGLGLFILPVEEAKEGDFVARYSRKPIDHTEHESVLAQACMVRHL